jgi:hypothetical protein
LRTPTEELAEIGAWAWISKELNFSGVINIRQDEKSDNCDHALFNKANVEPVKSLGLEAHVQRETRLPKFSQLERYLRETNSQNLSVQERMMRNMMESPFATTTKPN